MHLKPALAGSLLFDELRELSREYFDCLVDRGDTLAHQLYVSETVALLQVVKSPPAWLDWTGATRTHSLITRVTRDSATSASQMRIHTHGLCTNERST